MNRSKKRERNVNFTREETDKLVSLVEARKNIIENKKNDAVTWQEKEKAWKVIEEDFNSCSDRAFRDAKHLKLKYEALKRDTRKKCSLLRAERYKTGGGSREAHLLTPTELKVKEMILLSAEGGESTFDSDLLEVAENEESSGIVVLAESNVQPINAEGTLTNNQESCGIIVLAEPDVQNVNVEEELTNTDVADYASNIVTEVPKKLPTKRCITHDSVPSTSFVERDEDVSEIPQKWCEGKPASLRSKKHPVLCKPRKKRPFDRLAEGKLEVVSIQKQILREELEEKLLKKQLLQNEIEYNKQIHELRKKELLLKIELLKMEFENKKKLS